MRRVVFYDASRPWPRRLGESKAMLRRRLGLLRPIRCPRCRIYTNQMATGIGRRSCLACGETLTRASARRSVLSA